MWAHRIEYGGGKMKKERKKLFWNMCTQQMLCQIVYKHSSLVSVFIQIHFGTGVCVRLQMNANFTSSKYEMRAQKIPRTHEDEGKRKELNHSKAKALYLHSVCFT